MPTKHKLCYAGIGSEDTPNDVLCTMTRLVSWLESEGLLLRADADAAVGVALEQGISNIWNMRLYAETPYCHDRASRRLENRAMLPDAVSRAVRQGDNATTQGLARKAFGVSGSKPELANLISILIDPLLGYSNTVTYRPVAFVLCYIPGHARDSLIRAIEVASDARIPIFNLAYEDPVPIRHAIDDLINYHRGLEILG